MRVSALFYNSTLWSSESHLEPPGWKGTISTYGLYAKGAIRRLARRSCTIGLADGQHCADFRSIHVKLSEYLKLVLDALHSKDASSPVPERSEAQSML